MSEATAKKDIQKLQRTVVDALEDVKAQDVRVFDTEHISPLFERVIIATGSSNRQTKALAASVCDKVRENGFAKPRVEGEENGEWIIVDCGRAVVHILQPAFRKYYNLEELWGEKAVRLKSAAAKKAVTAKKTGAKTSVEAAEADEAPAAAAVAQKAPGKRAGTAKTKSAAVAADAEAPAAQPSRKPAAKKSVAAVAEKPAAKTASKAPAKKAAGKTTGARKTAAKPKASAPLKTLVVNKPVAKKTTARKKPA